MRHAIPPRNMPAIRPIMKNSITISYTERVSFIQIIQVVSSPAANHTSNSKSKQMSRFRVFEYVDGKSVQIGRSTYKMTDAVSLAMSAPGPRKVVKYSSTLPNTGVSIWCTSRGFIGTSELSSSETFLKQSQ